MRALFRSAITLGLNNIPVKLATVVRDSGTGLSNACPHCQGDVGKIDRCKECSAEVTNDQMQKAYKLGDKKIIFSKHQTDALKSIDKAIEIIGTIPKDSLDIRNVVGSYYVLPDKMTKAWAILRAGLNNSDEFIAVKYAIRGKQRLGILTPAQDFILLLTYAYNEQVVQNDEDLQIQITDKEKDIGISFVKSLKQIDISTIPDDYTKKLEQLIEGKDVTAVINENKSNELAIFGQ